MTNLLAKERALSRYEDFVTTYVYIPQKFLYIKKIIYKNIYLFSVSTELKYNSYIFDLILTQF